MLEQKDHSATGGRSFSTPKSGVAARTAQALTQGKHFSYPSVPAFHLNAGIIYSSKTISYMVATLNYSFMLYPEKEANLW